MGQAVPHAIGRFERFFAKKETTYGTFVQPTANDTSAGEGEAKILTSAMSVVTDRQDRDDKRNTRSLQERVDGKNAVEASAEMYILPVASGTIPDAGATLKNWLGVENIRTFLTVVDYTNGALDTVTVTLDGTPTVLTEGTDFSAVTDNNTTATNIATAIDGVTGYSASATGAVVTVLAVDGSNTSTIATGDATAWTATPTADVRYSFSKAQDAHGSLSLTRHVPDASDNDLGVVQEAVTGFAAQEGTISMSGGDIPTISVSGFGSTHIHTGASTLDGALSGSETQITVDDPDNFEVGSVFAIYRASTGVLDNGTGDGYRVTVKAAGLLDVTPSIVLAADDADLVIPFVPADTTAGSPIPGIQATFNLGPTGGSLTALKVQSFEVTDANQHVPFDDEAGEQNVTDYHPGDRVVSGSITLRARRDFIVFLGTRKTFAVQDIQVLAGQSDGSQILIDVTCELEFEALDIPQGAESAIITLPFRGLSSAGEGELAVTIT
jgi:hypothetical protein